ncbi:hypothetical protein QJQ45_016443 [Haematococcus lacustris]|nr:hypothetical protein QJQ45_016443 [Haematococcus lacustris]
MANAPTLTINVRPAQHSPPSRESDGPVKTADPDVEATVCRCCPAPTQTPDERLANWQHHIPERSTFSSFDLIGLFFLQPVLIGLSALDIGFSVQVIDTLLPVGRKHHIMLSDSSFGGLIEKASSTKPVTGEPGIPNEVIILQLCVALAVLVLLFNIGIWVVTIDTWWVDCNFEHLDDSELARKKGNGYLSCFSYWLAHWWLAKLSCLCCCLPSCVWLLIEIVLQVLFRFLDRIASAVSWACSFLNVAQILVYACILNKGLGNIVVAGLLFTALTILVLIKSLAASFIFIQVHRLNTVLAAMMGMVASAGNFRMDGPLGLCIANLMFSYVIAGATILWAGFVFNVVGRFVQRFCDMSECGLTAMLNKPSAPDANTLAKMRYRVQEETGVHGEKLVYLGSIGNMCSHAGPHVIGEYSMLGGSTVDRTLLMQADWHYVAEGGQAMGKVTPGDIPVTQHADANADVVQGAQKAARIAIVVMALGWLGLCIISSSLCLANFAKVSSLTLDPASRGWLEYDRATSVIILLSSCMLYPVYVYYTMQD